MTLRERSGNALTFVCPSRQGPVAHPGDVTTESPTDIRSQLLSRAPCSSQAEPVLPVIDCRLPSFIPSHKIGDVRHTCMSGRLLLMPGYPAIHVQGRASAAGSIEIRLL